MTEREVEGNSRGIKFSREEKKVRSWVNDKPDVPFKRLNVSGYTYIYTYREKET